VKEDKASAALVVAVVIILLLIPIGCCVAICLACCAMFKANQPTGDRRPVGQQLSAFAQQPVATFNLGGDMFKEPAPYAQPSATPRGWAGGGGAQGQVVGVVPGQVLQGTVVQQAPALAHPPGQVLQGSVVQNGPVSYNTNAEPVHPGQIQMGAVTHY